MVEAKNIIIGIAAMIVGLIFLIIGIMSWIVYIPVFSNFYLGEALGIGLLIGGILYMVRNK